MKAIWISKYGGPEVLQMRETPLPEPTDQSIIVEVRAFGINFADLLARMGLYPDAPSAPFVCGYEVSGVVTAVGKNCAAKVGDRVLGFTNFGGYAQVARIEAPWIIPLPEGMSFEEGAAIAVNYGTAIHCLYHVRKLYPGDRVLIHAACGGVGLAAVQIAKDLGAEIFATVGNAEKVAFLQKWGVPQIINYRESDFVAAIREITHGQGVDLILDSIGGETLARGMGLLRSGGTMVSFGAAALSSGPRRKLFHIWRELRKLPKLHPMGLLNGSRGFVGVNLKKIADKNLPLLQHIAQAIPELIEKGVIKPVIGTRLPAEQIAQAHQKMQSRDSIGKIVMTW